MARKAVAFVLPDLRGGGAQRVLLALAEALDQERFAARVLVVGGNDILFSEVSAGVVLEQGGARRLSDGLPWLVRRLRNLKPAVVISVMGYLNLALLALRPILPSETRIIVREANAVAATVAALPALIPTRCLYRSLYPKADRIVSPTQIIADEIADFAPRAANRIVVLRNPVNIERLRTRAIQPKRHPGPGLRLVSAGRLTHQKGFDRLLTLLPHLPPHTHVTILGEGPFRERLEAQAQVLGVADRFTLAGFSADVPAWIAGADAFLLPSRWEGLPNVVLESLAVGTPAIVSSEANMSELERAAPRGAVSIRSVGQAFVDAISAVAPSLQSAPSLRPNLLPPSYSREVVVQDWCRLLECVTSCSNLKLL